MFEQPLQRLSVRLPHASTVFLCCVVPVGAMHDPVRRSGLAHFTEHMVSRSARLMSGDYSCDYEAALKFGSYVDAYVELNRTCFEMEVPAEHYPAAREWLTQLVCTLSFSENDWRREQRVLWLQLRDRPYTYDINLLLRRLVYGARSQYARPLGGTLLSLRRTTAADIRRFWHTHYRPEQMFLLEVGALPHGIEPENLSTLARRPHFLTRDLRSTPRNGPIVRFTARRMHTLDIDIAFLIPDACVQDTPRLLSVLLLPRLLEVKLMQRLRHEQGDISDAYGSLNRYPLSLDVEMEAIGRHPVQVLERVFQAVSECRQVNPDDLIAVSRLRLTYLRGLTNSPADFGKHLLSPTGILYADNLRLQEQILTTPSRTAETVRDVAQRILASKNLILMLRGGFSRQEKEEIKENAHRIQ